MPIRAFLESEPGAFAPEDITAMTAAFEDTLRALRLTDRTDPLVTTVAKLTIVFAKRGEREPTRLREAVLKALLVLVASGPSRDGRKLGA
jgi:hypothetical protein